MLLVLLVVLVWPFTFWRAVGALEPKRACDPAGWNDQKAEIGQKGVCAIGRNGGYETDARKERLVIGYNASESPTLLYLRAQLSLAYYTAIGGRPKGKRRRRQGEPSPSLFWGFGGSTSQRIKQRKR